MNGLFEQTLGVPAGLRAATERAKARQSQSYFSDADEVSEYDNGEIIDVEMAKDSRLLENKRE